LPRFLVVVAGMSPVERMVQSVALGQRFARERPRSVLMTRRFSICENDSNVGQFWCAPQWCHCCGAAKTPNAAEPLLAAMARQTISRPERQLIQRAETPA